MAKRKRNIPSDLELDMEAFLRATEGKGCAASTMQWYRSQLRLLRRFLEKVVDVHKTEDIKSEHLTRYLVSLRKKGCTPNSVHAAYRVLRRFLRWYNRTQHPAPDWRNPIHEIEAPIVPRKRLPAPSFDDIKAILAAITTNSDIDCRDRAIITFMLETGLRSKEMLNLNIGDIELKRRRAIVRETKNGTSRLVYFDSPVDKLLARYMRRLPPGLPSSAPLWLAFTRYHQCRKGDRLTYWGLRLMLKRRAEAAGVPMPKLHGLRRAFATAKHRQGVTALDLQRMLGHSDGQTLWRYVDIDEAYMERVQRATSVVGRYLVK